MVASVEADAKKFYETGNAAAGTRVRKMQDLKKLVKTILAEVTEMKDAK